MRALMMIGILLGSTSVLAGADFVTTFLSPAADAETKICNYFPHDKKTLACWNEAPFSDCHGGQCMPVLRDRFGDIACYCQ